MTLLPFGVVVASVLFAPPAQPPAFRTEAYIIPFYITLSHGKKHYVVSFKPSDDIRMTRSTTSE